MISFSSFSLSGKDFNNSSAKRPNLKILFTFLFVWSSCLTTWSQSLNYEEIFGSDWKKAVAFEQENRNWIEPLFAKYDVSYAIGISVIFPELVRYSALRDKMEITLLKTLYVNLGEEYANFSIGVMQMKPSFAEAIREKSTNTRRSTPGLVFKKKSEFESIYDYRRSIVKDLEDPRIQVSYLISFLKICQKEFKTGRKDEISQIRFLATAYNYGIDRSVNEIEKMTDKKFFNTKLFRSENYSYADVSVFWYKQFTALK